MSHAIAAYPQAPSGLFWELHWPLYRYALPSRLHASHPQVGSSGVIPSSGHLRHGASWLLCVIPWVVPASASHAHCCQILGTFIFWWQLPSVSTVWVPVGFALGFNSGTTICGTLAESLVGKELRLAVCEMLT